MTEMDHYSFRCDETFVEKLKVKSPITESAWGSVIAGCCNGLLLIVNLNASVSDMYLWNPSLGKIKPLPSAYATYKKKNYVEAFGLAFLPEVCDYKVIRILNFASDDFSIAEIYSLGTNSWRRIEAPVKRLMPLYNCPFSAAFVNPFFYWVGTDRECILSFNLKSETFKTIILPDACLDAGNLDGYAVFQESLYLVTFRMSEGWTLWMMKENYSSVMSCLKICTISRGSPVGFMKNGDVIVENLENKVSLHDPRNVSSPRNSEYEIRWGLRSSAVYNYSPSLALLDQRKGGV